MLTNAWAGEVGAVEEADLREEGAAGELEIVAQREDEPCGLEMWQPALLWLSRL